MVVRRQWSESGLVSVRLSDVAEMVHDDWCSLATQLRGITDHDVDDIRARYSYPSEQVDIIELYIPCWREHSRRKLSPTLATLALQR